MNDESRLSAAPISAAPESTTLDQLISTAYLNLARHEELASRWRAVFDALCDLLPVEGVGR